MAKTTSPRRPRAKPPNSRHDGATEQRILEAARAVFMRKGTAGARMQEIAAEAGVNQALLHYYFRSKERLSAAVFQQVAMRLFPAIAEILGPVENPRYLLVRHSWLGPRTRTDYHAVPSALGAKKEWAERFAALWNLRVGSASLVYARTPAGRRTLLRARMKSFAAGFQRSVDRRSAWL